MVHSRKKLVLILGMTVVACTMHAMDLPSNDDSGSFHTINMPNNSNDSLSVSPPGSHAKKNVQLDQLFFNIRTIPRLADKDPQDILSALCKLQASADPAKRHLYENLCVLLEPSQSQPTRAGNHLSRQKNIDTIADNILNILQEEHTQKLKEQEQRARDQKQIERERIWNRVLLGVNIAAGAVTVIFYGVSMFVMRCQ